MRDETPAAKVTTYTLDDAQRGGPGLDGYAYQGDWYCVSCGRDIAARVWEQRTEPWEDWEFCDSDEVPQPIFFGESEYEQHCGDCGEYMFGGGSKICQTKE